MHPFFNIYPRSFREFRVGLLYHWYESESPTWVLNPVMMMTRICQNCYYQVLGKTVQCCTVTVTQWTLQSVPLFYFDIPFFLGQSEAAEAEEYWKGGRALPGWEFYRAAHHAGGTDDLFAHKGFSATLQAVHSAPRPAGDGASAYFQHAEKCAQFSLKIIFLSLNRFTCEYR